MAARRFQQLAETARLIEALAAGEAELTFTDGPVPELPPPDAPHVLIRAVAVPYAVDERARQDAAERAVDPEDVLAEWVAAGRRQPPQPG